MSQVLFMPIAHFLLLLILVLHDHRRSAALRPAHSITKRTYRVRSILRMTTSELKVNSLGDCTSVSYSLLDENSQVPDTPFDQGDVSFIINGGGLHPFVHKFAETVQPGEGVKTGSVFGGEYHEQMAANVPLGSAPPVVLVNRASSLHFYLKICQFAS